MIATSSTRRTRRNVAVEGRRSSVSGRRSGPVVTENELFGVPDAPERLRSLMDAVFAMQAELNLPLELEAVVEVA
ncbi:hypothetical protein [Streptomyces sp. BE308]|uniref:hypothetical protein n=1 Tax=Streptomyces sp. BE308 TaxID=3002529 RepID=UPI002E794243|nr:hypothetical protein [Streptomyces sp. BE308]